MRGYVIKRILATIPVMAVVAVFVFYLLRYYPAEGGLHPDKDVQIRVVPPPETVANLKAGNVGGSLAPRPVQPACCL